MWHEVYIGMWHEVYIQVCTNEVPESNMALATPWEHRFIKDGM